MLFLRVFFFLSFIFFQFPLYAKVVCLGLECNQIPVEYLLLGNFANPLVDEVYTNEFLNSMGGAAVLQNINSSMSGGRKNPNTRLGLGYSASQSKVKPNDFYYENTELRELPNMGVAASPSFSGNFNLGHWLDKPALANWNLNLHFFPYEFGEANLPFVKVRNTDVNGRVSNFGAMLRYFPSETGFNFGFGIFHTHQDIGLKSYDRRPTQFRLDGVKRRWIGTNDLFYQSRITSFNVDSRYVLTKGAFTFNGGLGFVLNDGYTSVKARRNAFISMEDSPDDFTSNPSSLFLELDTKQRMKLFMPYALVGIQYSFEHLGFGLEYMVGDKLQSLNISTFLQF
ncbi:hypothetical protein P3G55_03580 [Leptospira sp. 96542]|nr:hypothetical protein [Leptospira sp. 96542]